MRSTLAQSATPLLARMIAPEALRAFVVVGLAHAGLFLAIGLVGFRSVDWSWRLFAAAIVGGPALALAAMGLLGKSRRLALSLRLAAWLVGAVLCGCLLFLDAGLALTAASKRPESPNWLGAWGFLALAVLPAIALGKVLGGVLRGWMAWRGAGGGSR